jgi:hypothetical protein
MAKFRILWRDADRLPYLYTLKSCVEQYGLEVEMARAQGQEYADLAIRGDAEMLLENYWNLQFSRAKGEPLICVGSALSSINETIVAGPGITRLEDLNGKRLAYRDMRPTNLIDPLWARESRLGVELVPANEREVGRWQSWRLVQSGAADAAIVSKLFADEPTKQGLTPISMGTFGFLGSVVFTTTRQVIDSRPGDIEAFIKGAFDAAQTFKHDRAASLSIMRGAPEKLMSFDVEGDAHLERLWEILSEEIAETPLPTAEAISNFHRMTFPEYEELKGYNPLTMWDTSFALRELDRRKAGVGA